MPKSKAKKANHETKNSSEKKTVNSQPNVAAEPIESTSTVVAYLNYMREEEQETVLATLDKKGYIRTRKTYLSEDKYPVEGSLLVDLLLNACTEPLHFWNLVQDLTTYQQALIRRLVDSELLRQLQAKLEKLHSSIVEEFFQSLFFDYHIDDDSYHGMSFLGYCLYSKNISLLSYLFGKTKTNARFMAHESREIDRSVGVLALNAKYMNPHSMGVHFDGNIVQWLLTLCIQDSTYYSFFLEIHPILLKFINKFNKSQTKELQLPNPTAACERFSPLAFVLSQGNLEFASWLMTHFKKQPWLKELGSRTAEGICPLWIPYLPAHYSFNKTYFEKITVIPAGVDVKKLIHCLLTSLTRNDDLAQFTPAKRTKIRKTAKLVFENSLNHPPLFALFNEHSSSDEIKTEADPTILRKLARFSKDKRLLDNIEKVANQLQETTELAHLLDIYGIITALSTPHMGSSAKVLLGDLQIDDLFCITKLLEYILSFLDPNLLNAYLESPHYASFNLQSKMLKIPSNYRAELSELLKRIHYDVGGIEERLKSIAGVLLNPLGTTEGNAVDLKLASLTAEVGEIEIGSLSDSLERVLALRQKCIINSEGFLVGAKSLKKAKTKAAKVPDAPPQPEDPKPIPNDALDKQSETKAEESLPPASRAEKTPIPPHKAKPAKPGSRKKLGKNSKIYLNLPEPEHKPTTVVPLTVKVNAKPLPLLEEKSSPKPKETVASPSTPPAPLHYPQDPSTAFQDYVSLYLQKMYAEIGIFSHNFIRLFREQPEHNHIAKKANFKAISHITGIEQLILNLLPHVPQTGNECPPEEILWDIMGLAHEHKKTPIASMSKFKTIFRNTNDRLGLITISETRKLFHIWNDFMTEHLITLAALQTVPDVQLRLDCIDCKAALKPLTHVLHWGFIAQRYKTDSEENIHAMVLDIVRSFTRAISRSRSGMIGRVLEHGTQIFGLMKLEPSFSSDMDIVIEVVSSPDHCDALIKDFIHVLKEIKIHYPGTEASFLPKFKAQDSSSFQWELMLHNGYKIDLLFSLKRYESSIVDSIFPYAMLAEDLNDHNLFTPANSFDLIDLFTVLSKAREQIEAWVRDPTKIAFILRGLSKAYQEPIPQEPMLFLMGMVHRAINNMLSQAEQKPELSQISRMNPISYLFGRPSLRIGGFHSLLIKYDLTRIFDLTLAEDGDFLRWFDITLQAMENKVAGSTRACAGLISTENYLTIIFHYILDKNTKKNSDPLERLKIINHLKTLELRCLYTKPTQPKPRAVETAILIEAQLAQKCYRIPLGDLFPLRERYASLVGVTSALGTLFGSAAVKPGALVGQTTSSPVRH